MNLTRIRWLVRGVLSLIFSVQETALTIARARHRLLLPGGG
jgi:hypothetical protein